MQTLKLVFLVLAMLALNSVNAQTAPANYIGTDNNWFEPTNWDTGTVPNATTDVLLNNVDVQINPALSPTGTVQVHNIQLLGTTKLVLLDGTSLQYNNMNLSQTAIFESHSSEVSGNDLVLDNTSGAFFNPTTNDNRSILIIAKSGPIKMFLGGTIAASPGNTGMGHYATLLADDVELNGRLSVESIYGFNPRIGDTFQIVTARNSLSGRFDNVKEGNVVARMNGVDLVISYFGGDGNDVVLTAVESRAIPIAQIRADAEAQAAADIAFMQSFNSSTNKAAATFASVGGAGCEFATVQAGIDAGRDEVRIVTDTTFNENIFITNVSTLIRGGYSTCTNANSDIQSLTKSQIIGIPNAGEPVIAITGNNQRNTVILENLDLSGGTGGNFLTGGGISTLNSDAEVMLKNIDIHDNHSDTGGGIAIQGTENTDTDFMLIDTLVYNNTTSKLGGGGLYCSGANSSVVVTGQSGFSFNTANKDPNVFLTGAGGGIYIDDACQFSMYSGSSQIDNTNLIGISYNTAHGSGGVAVGSGTVTLNGHKMCADIQGQQVCIGNNDQPININNNISTLNGGGITVGGKVSLFAALLANNVSNNSPGGGVTVGTQAEFNTGRLYQACWNQQKCNWIKNNSNNSRGGGIWTINNNTTNIFSTVIEGNRASVGTAIYSEYTDLKVENSLIIHNGGGGMDGFDDQTVITTTSFQNNFGLTNISNTTISDNNITTSTLSIDDNFSIQSSIIDAPNGAPLVQADIVNYNKTGVFDCLVSSELSSLSLSANISVNNAQIADPQFVDRAGGDYHLASNSPAIDLCLKSFIEEKDIDLQVRGYDDPNVANYNNSPLFTSDAGADETYTSDIIFKNGFENTL